MKKVSAVIPNYNGKTLLSKHLPDVFKSLEDGDELIVVDDFSTDGSVKYLIRTYKLQLTKKAELPTQVSQNYFPQPKDLKYKLYINVVTVGKKKISFYLVALEKNMRFAASANFGVLFASGDYILLLNSDVKPTKTVRNQLLENFKDLDVFGVGCLEYEKDISGEKSGKNKLWFEFGMFKHSKALNMKSGTSAWVSGGSGMFDKQKWVHLNGFDQLYYPAYWEDVDLSFRAKQSGWKVLFDEKAVVFHIHESTNTDVFGKAKIMDMSWTNSIRFVKKNGNFWQLIQYYIFSPYWNHKRTKYLEKNKTIL